MASAPCAGTAGVLDGLGSAVTLQNPTGHDRPKIFEIFASGQALGTRSRKKNGKDANERRKNSRNLRISQVRQSGGPTMPNASQ